MTHSKSSSTPQSQPSPLQGWLLLVLVAVVLFAVRVTGPSNLLDNDQERPASYVMDAVLNGHWWCQTDWTGDIMSKPPLFTWMGALATLPVGHANLVSLYFPCLLAMLLTVGLIYHFARQHFNWAAGFLAGLMYLAAPSGVKHIALARTDALFAATIALTALVGYRAWTTGRGWPWFWLGAALATLTKGPLGILLASMGFLAVVWEWVANRRTASEVTSATKPKPTRHRFWFGQFTGIALFLLIALGWFWLAYRQSGQAFIDKVIGRELVGHIVSEKHGTFGIGFVKAPLYWLSRFLPWSVLAVIGLWRVARRPATDPAERRFERFLFCWIVGGLFLFSLASHQRGDLPLPLYAPAALLAGREVARWLSAWKPKVIVWCSLTVVGVALVLYTIYLHTLFAQTWEVRQSEAVEAFARQLRNSDALPMHHVDSPYALQFHLNTMQPWVTLEFAADELASGRPCTVALRDPDALRELVGDRAQLHSLGSCPGSQEGSTLWVISNQPE